MPMPVDVYDLTKYLPSPFGYGACCGNGAPCVLKLPPMPSDEVPVWTCRECLVAQRPGRRSKEELLALQG